MADDHKNAGATHTGGSIVDELAAEGLEDAQEVGRGAAGVVYRCYQASVGRTVAVKVLTSDFDDHARGRFMREGFAMGRLSGHPNIVNILQVGATASNRMFIVMPYHSADSLAVRLHRSGPLPWPEVLKIGVKLCGALETAHKSGTLHRDIKPGNVLQTEYGEPQLTDFGIARIEGGYETVTGLYAGTIAFTPPEVLSGYQPTAVADVYSLGATLYALIAGAPAHENSASGQIVTQYLRITSEPIPDLRATHGIPSEVVDVIERAMALEATKRPQSASEFGRELQGAQRRMGLPPDTMALSAAVGGEGDGSPTVSVPGSVPGSLSGSSGPARSSGGGGRRSGEALNQMTPNSLNSAGNRANSAPQQASDPSWPRSTNPGIREAPHPFPGSAGRHSAPPIGSEPQRGMPLYGPQPERPAGSGVDDKTQKRRLIALAAAAVALVVVVATVIFVTPHGGDSGGGGGGSGSKSTNAGPTPEPQAPWKPITNARIARAEVATVQTDGTIWIFGGVTGDGMVSGGHEGYDPTIDSWKGGDDLPVPVRRSSAVDFQENPVVLGGIRADKTTSDQVWRVVNGRWVELPSLLQPRSAAAATVIGDHIIVTGGVDGNGKLLNTTEIFDGASWTPGAPIPTRRQLASAASDGKVMYVVGGNSGNADLGTVEAFDPAANTWAPLPALAQPRSDLGVAFTDARLVAVGGVSNGQVLKSSEVFDIASKSWAALPDMSTARHGMAVAPSLEKTVYAIGGFTAAGETEATSSAESVKLLPRKLQPASQWRTLPDGPTPRMLMAGTVVDNKVWLAGGMGVGMPGMPGMPGMDMGEMLQSVESYDPATGTWQSQPPLPTPMHHATGATYRGEPIVLGGTTGDIAESSNKVWVLRGGTWMALPNMNHARAGAAAAAVGDKLVVVGGQNDKKLVPQTEVFDGTSWTDAADMPTPREHLAAVSDGTYLYAIGGRFLASDKNSAAFSRFDPGSGEWTTMPDMPSPHGSFGAAFVDGRIVAVGGEEPTQVIGTAAMFDIAEGKWSVLPPMPTPRHAVAVAAVGHTVYVICGANRPSHEAAVSTIEALDFS